MTLSITTFSITTLSIKGLYVTLSISDTQEKRQSAKNTSIMLSVAICLRLCWLSLCWMSWCHKRPPVDIMLATTKPPLSLVRSIRLGFNRLISTSSLWRPTCCRSCKSFCSSSLTPRTNKLERLYLPSFFRQFHSLLVSPEPSWRREREST
jgi:hypothetical protein